MPIFAKPVQNSCPWFYLTVKIKIDLIFYIKVAFDFLKQFQCLVDKTLSCVESKYLEVVAQSSSMKIIFLEISQNLENTCAGVSFLIKLKAGNLQLHSKGISAQVFFCEFCETFMNTYFVKHLRAAASVYYQANINNLLVPDLLFVVF